MAAGAYTGTTGSWYFLDGVDVRNARARDVILLEGINDIGFSQTPNSGCFVPNTSVSARQIEHGYEELIRQAHARGLKIFGGTLTPFKGSFYWSPAAEATREAVKQLDQDEPRVVPHRPRASDGTSSKAGVRQGARTVRSKRRRRAGSASTLISTIYPRATVNPSTA